MRDSYWMDSNEKNCKFYSGKSLRRRRRRRSRKRKYKLVSRWINCDYRFLNIVEHEKKLKEKGKKVEREKNKERKKRKIRERTIANDLWMNAMSIILKGRRRENIQRSIPMYMLEWKIARNEIRPNMCIIAWPLLKLVKYALIYRRAGYKTRSTGNVVSPAAARYDFAILPF